MQNEEVSYIYIYISRWKSQRTVKPDVLGASSSDIWTIETWKENHTHIHIKLPIFWALRSVSCHSLYYLNPNALSYIDSWERGMTWGLWSWSKTRAIWWQYILGFLRGGGDRDGALTFITPIKLWVGKEGMRDLIKGKDELNEILRGRRKNRWELMPWKLFFFREDLPTQCLLAGGREVHGEWVIGNFIHLLPVFLEGRQMPLERTGGRWKQKVTDKNRILGLLVSSRRYTAEELVLFGLVVSHCSYNNSVNQPSGSSLHLLANSQAVLLISNQYRSQKARYSRHWSPRTDLLSSSRRQTVCRP